MPRLNKNIFNDNPAVLPWQEQFVKPVNFYEQRKSNENFLLSNMNFNSSLHMDSVISNMQSSLYEDGKIIIDKSLSNLSRGKQFVQEINLDELQKSNDK